MMNLFGDGGTSVWIDSVGPELTVRKDEFEYVFSVWWADYSMGATPFKASSDPDTAWEIVRSKMNVLYLTSDFNWSNQVSPVVGINLGVGAGFGLVWGDLLRTQAYPVGPAGNPDSYEPCQAPGVPPGIYCANDNKHYNYLKRQRQEMLVQRSKHDLMCVKPMILIVY